jgi:hypothetical protein
VAPERVVVLVPGILGSVLKDGAGGWIWSDDFLDNYNTLKENPGLLSWVGTKAKAQLLKTARAGFFAKIPLWDVIHHRVRLPPDFGDPPRIVEFGYDWRQSNVDSAEDLGIALSNFLGCSTSAAPQNGEKRRFTFVMHSMGGLVVRVAIGKGIIHVDWIDRLIHIGSPLFGAQSAFGTLFGGDDDDILPLLSTVVRWTRRRNAQKFLETLRSCIRTCPSVYELLPRGQIPFISYSSIAYTNPLNEEYLAPKMRQYAFDAHLLLNEGTDVLKKAKRKSFAIFTNCSPSRGTNIMYRVEAQQHGYRILETIGKTYYGDGTVPSDSARGDVTQDDSIPVFDVKHAEMCRDLCVGKIVQSVL